MHKLDEPSIIAPSPTILKIAGDSIIIYGRGVLEIGVLIFSAIAFLSSLAFLFFGICVYLNGNDLGLGLGAAGFIALLTGIVGFIIAYRSREGRWRGRNLYKITKGDSIFFVNGSRGKLVLREGVIRDVVGELNGAPYFALWFIGEAAGGRADQGGALLHAQFDKGDELCRQMKDWLKEREQGAMVDKGDTPP